MHANANIIKRRLRITRTAALSGHGNVASITPVAHVADFDKVRLHNASRRRKEARGW